MNIVVGFCTSWVTCGSTFYVSIASKGIEFEEGEDPQMAIKWSPFSLLIWNVNTLVNKVLVLPSPFQRELWVLGIFDFGIRLCCLLNLELAFWILRIPIFFNARLTIFDNLEFHFGEFLTLTGQEFLKF